MRPRSPPNPLPRRWLLLLPATLTTALLFGGGLAGAVRASLQPDPFGPASLDAWNTVLRDGSFWDGLAFSAGLSVVATALSATFALAAAALFRDRGPVLQGLFGFPVLVPHLIVATLMVLWVGPGGIADRALGSLPVELIRDGRGLGIVLVYLVKEIPFLFVVLLAAWSPDVLEHEEAAALAGAGPWQRMRWVIWPALRRPLVIGSLIVAAFVFGSFEVPIVVGPTYPLTLPALALQATATAELAGRAQAAVILLVTAFGSLILAVVAARHVRRTDV